MLDTLENRTADAFADWEPWRLEELRRDAYNGRVGMKLLSETDRVRVWSIDLPPGERLPFHRHVLDYFWTAVANGKARHHYDDGRIVEVENHVGETKHLTFKKGEYFIHDLENIGDTNLVFITVEFLQGENAPLPLD